MIRSTISIPPSRTLQWILSVILLAVVLAACGSPSPSPDLSIQVEIQADNTVFHPSVPAGSTVQRALVAAGLTIGSLDRVTPSGITPITSPITIKVTRIQEEFDTQEITIPFAQQVVRNETLADGQTLRIQAGENGTEQITYRTLLEDGQQVSRTIVKTTIVQDPKPEILMVGIKAPFTAQPIPGRLVYIVAGNAWMMQGTSADRKPLITSGDLDGRVLRLSRDGKWMLYTRASGKDASVEINTLWAANLTEDPIKTYNLQARNIITFADWMPGQMMAVVYSTVEPRSAAPGWQANNDLNLLKFTRAGNLAPVEEILAPNSGGVYGWWGTQFGFSPDGNELFFARPDSIGLVDLKKGQLSTLLTLNPYDSRSNWAWLPGIATSPDSSILYTVTHPAESGAADPGTSQVFSLAALNTKTGLQVNLVPDVGMFAYPSCSSLDDNKNFSIAYMQAIFPRQSADSRYRLWVMEQDGSNPRPLFPAEDSTGLDPQQVLWSPDNGTSSSIIALIYQGNLWLVDSSTGAATQVTGDGLMTQFDWK